MPQPISRQDNWSLIGLLGLLMAAAGVVMWSGVGATNAMERKLSGHARLISVQPMPADGEMCQPIRVSAVSSLAEALAAEPGASDSTGDEVTKRAPVKTLHDPWAGYSAVAVDPQHNEVAMTDENLFSVLVYNRTENTPPSAKMSEPKRIIRGDQTNIEFQCSIYIDPANGDIYAVNNDTLGKLVIFSHEAKGNAPPERFINTPHTTFGIAVDEKTQELLLTVQDDAAVVAYPKDAKEDEQPIRLLQGVHTGLADPHGLAVDAERDLLYVSNWGTVNVHVPPQGGAKTGTHGRGKGQPNWPIGRNYAVPGSGKIFPPSITVYPRDAKGDQAPARVLQGPNTRLNWPTALSVNPKTGELFVANDTDHSILVFDRDASGDVAPIRILKGPKTLIQNPTGVYYDPKNDELWVSNFGGHAATVYKATASGDTAPLRVIRSGPPDAPSPMLGNPNPVIYDSKRDQLLVAN